jgi:hypothetical protein
MAEMTDHISGIDPLLFTKTLEFAGVFRDGDLATNPLSVEIRYSPLNAHPPIGTIRGTASDWPELESFFYRRKSSLCEFESVSAARRREKVRSTQVLLRQISIRHHPADERTVIQQVLGHFELHDITIDCDYGQHGTQNRRMTFLVRGPALIWMSDAIRSFSYLGITKTKFPHAHLRLSRAEDVRVTAQPYFLYASLPAERLLLPREDGRGQPLGPHLSAEAEAFALTVTDRHLDRQDADFEARALEVAEILFLIVSFLSKAYVTWYGRTFWSDGRLLENYRHVPETSDLKLGWEDIVLHPKDVRAFISNAFTTCQENAHGGVNLRLLILIYVAAQSAPTVDERFILLFSCLEKVVDMLDRKYVWEVIKPSELKTIKLSLRRQLSEMGKDTQTARVITEKIPELARPGFLRRFSEHLKRLKVDLDDIGGHDALRDTIKVRNSLIHSAEEVPIARMVREQKRLQTVVERTLLALLNWRRTTNTPTFANRMRQPG